MPLKFQLEGLTLTPLRVRGKSYSKTDRPTYGFSKTTFLDGLKVVHIPNPVLYSIFLHDANTSIDMEVKTGPEAG